MKFKTRPMTKLLATALCAALMLSSASAYEVQSSTKTSTIEGVKYEYWASLYVDSTNKYRAATWANRTDNKNIPSGTTVYTQAFLCNADGTAIDSTGFEPHDSGTSFSYAVTSANRTTEAVYSKGKVKISVNGDESLLTTSKTTNVGGSRSVLSADDFVAQLADQTLTADGQYPTTEAGKTYGSTLLSDIVGEEPDLISALGTNGRSGYIRSEDTDIEDDGQDHVIPLYSLDEEVIGSFVIHASSTNDIPEVEETIERLRNAALLAQTQDEVAQGQAAAVGASVSQVTTLPVTTLNVAQDRTTVRTTVNENWNYHKETPKAYDVNSHGQTYGSWSWSDEIGYEPDLISCRATNGQDGYMLRTDEEELTWVRKGFGYIPVYDVECETVIGEFYISCGSASCNHTACNTPGHVR